MNARMMLVGVLIVIVGIGAALGADIERIGPGGVWSNTQQWDPNQVPSATDNVIHGTQASGVVTFDGDVNDVNRTINNFAAFAGDGRSLTIDEELDLTVLSNFTRSSGTGAYVTELLNLSTLVVEGTIIRGNWVVGENALVDAGALTLSADTRWDLNGGTANVSGTVDSGTGSSANVFAVNSGGVLTVGGTTAMFSTLLVDIGGTAEITNDLRSHDIVQVRGGALTAGSAGVTGAGNTLGDLFIDDDGSVTVEGTLRLRDGDRLRYGPPDTVGNSLTVGNLVFEG